MSHASISLVRALHCAYAAVWCSSAIGALPQVHQWYRCCTSWAQWWSAGIPALPPEWWSGGIPALPPVYHVYTCSTTSKCLPTPLIYKLKESITQIDVERVYQSRFLLLVFRHISSPTPFPSDCMVHTHQHTRGGGRQCLASTNCEWEPI